MIVLLVLYLPRALHHIPMSQGHFKGSQVDADDGFDVILGNSNPRFSGVTSTMLQTLVHQQKEMNIRVLGSHHLTDSSLALSFWQAWTSTRKGSWRVFHARRNNEMIQALILKMLGARIKILFTSTAQRRHSGLTRWLMSRMDAVISTCQRAAAYLESPPKTLIAHGVQTDVFVPLKDRSQVLKEIGITTPHAIGIFGRVREQKGVHLFVRACIKVLADKPDVTGVVVGAISSKNQDFVSALQKEIAVAGLTDRIVFLGEQAFERIPRLFGAMSLVAALSYNEGFGLTPLEAWATGAAVLATEAGAWPEIIEDGVDGLVVPVGDQEAITEKMETLLSDLDLLEKMGASGRAKVLKDYTVEREASQLCEVYRGMQV